MKDLIELYLSNKKIYLILHLSYLIMCIIITQKILSIVFKIDYSFPDNINTATVLNFIMKGEVVLPLIFFLLVIFSFHYLKNLILWLIYFFKIRNKKFKDLESFVINLGQKFDWFQQTVAGLQRGRNYLKFVTILEGFTEGNELIGFTQLLNSLFFSFVFTIWVCPLSIILKLIFSLCLIAYYLFQTYNLFFIYSIQDNIQEFIRIRNLIENPQSQETV